MSKPPDQTSQPAEPKVEVKDRRSFDSDGQRRTAGPDGATTAEPDPPNQRASETSASRNWVASDINFMAFLHSLYISSLMALGEVADPETRNFATNLEMARQNIDIIVMLKAKTAGNLTREEDAFIQDLLPQLQLLYVKKAG